ncbi:MAG TPA: hypothetical protein VGS58_18260 [Candidatus Sulfopaludibacter sp.]|nr:hypothetical protein [Candidatus Sulfopaludibacter sp.]
MFSTPVPTFRGQGRFTNTYAWSDNASYFRGAHSIQFGVQWQRDYTAPYNDAGITPTYNVGISPANSLGLTNQQLPGANSSDIAAANNLLATLAGVLSGYIQTFNVSSQTSGFVKGQTQSRHWMFTDYSAYVLRAAHGQQQSRAGEIARAVRYPADHEVQLRLSAADRRGPSRPLPSGGPGAALGLANRRHLHASIRLPVLGLLGPGTFNRNNVLATNVLQLHIAPVHQPRKRSGTSAVLRIVWPERSPRRRPKPAGTVRRTTGIGSSGVERPPFADPALVGESGRVRKSAGLPVAPRKECLPSYRVRRNRLDRPPALAVGSGW